MVQYSCLRILYIFQDLLSEYQVENCIMNNREDFESLFYIGLTSLSQDIVKLIINFLLSVIKKSHAVVKWI